MAGIPLIRRNYVTASESKGRGAIIAGGLGNAVTFVEAAGVGAVIADGELNIGTQELIDGIGNIIQDSEFAIEESTATRGQGFGQIISEGIDRALEGFTSGITIYDECGLVQRDVRVLNFSGEAVTITSTTCSFTGLDVFVTGTGGGTNPVAAISVDQFGNVLAADGSNTIRFT